MRNSSQVVYTSPVAMAVQLSLCLVLLLTGVIGNGAICFLLLRFKVLRTVSNILLANLAFADLLNTLVNIPLFIMYHIYLAPSFNNSISAWWTTFLLIFFIKLNLTSMFVLVMDRFFAMAHAVKYSIWKSHRKAFMAVCAGWIIALLATYFITIPNYGIDLGTKSVLYYRIAYTSRGAKRNRAYNYISMGLLLIILTVITILTLLKIWKIGRMKRLILRKSNNETGGTAVRSAWTILMVFFSYTVCYISGSCFIISATFNVSVPNEQSNVLFFLAICSFFFGSSCNAFIYTIRSTKFRKALKELIGKRCPCKTGPVTSHRNFHRRKDDCRVFYINGTFGKQQILRMCSGNSNFRSPKSRRPRSLSFAKAKDSHGIPGRKQEHTH